MCLGSIKKLPNGTIVVVRPHSFHAKEDNNAALINNFRDILKSRASTESLLLKKIYDEEARRYVFTITYLLYLLFIKYYGHYPINYISTMIMKIYKRDYDKTIKQYKIRDI